MKERTFQQIKLSYWLELCNFLLIINFIVAVYSNSVNFSIKQLNNLFLKTALMSSSSKFPQTEVDAAVTSSRKSLEGTYSQQVTEQSASMCDHSESSIEREEVLELQIKQLRRENDFLKKKIQQLNQGIKNQKPERRRSSRKGVQRQDKEPVHLTIQFFYEQINSLLKSVSELFKVQLNTKEKAALQDDLAFQDQLNPAKKYKMVKKFIINRKLQKIMLEQEQNKYPQMLDVFTMFYKAKQQSDKFIKNLVDELSQKALDLNKMIVDKAQKKNLRGSNVRSHYTTEKTINDKNCLNTPHSSMFNIIHGKQILDNKLLKDLDLVDRERISKNLGRIL